MRQLIFWSAIILSIVGPSSDVLAQSRPKSENVADEGKVATAEEVDFTRFRVVTEQGILAVFDADEEWDGRDEPLSQLAYWHDLASEQLFFFDQRLFTLDDVLQSIATMQRDLDIELADVLAERPDFAPLPEINTPGQWRSALAADVLTVMEGGTVAGSREGEVSGLANPCVPTDCGPAMAMSGDLPAPVRGTSTDGLYAAVQSGTRCNCSAGSCTRLMCAPGSFCTDHNPCSGPDELRCYAPGCAYGESVCIPGPPINGIPCPDDGNPCKNDICLNRICTRPNLPDGAGCPDDGDTCTNDSCFSGQCTHPPICEDNDPCTNNLCAGGTCLFTPKCDDENECTEDTCTNGVCTNDEEARNGGSCETDNLECTLDVCRDGACEHESHGCTTAADCPQSNSLCKLPPVCGACGCRYPPKCNDGDPCSTDICHPQSGICEFLNFATLLPEGELCDYYGCEISMTGLPDVFLLNDDDDNGNGNADYLDAPPVDNENDNELVEITLNSWGCYPDDGAGGIPSSYCPGHYTGLPDHWRTVASPEALGTYLNTDRDPYVWPSYSEDWPPPGVLYVDGGQMSSCPQGWELRLVYDDPPGYFCRWRSPTVSVVKIESLTWEALPGNAPLDDSPAGDGIGIRSGLGVNEQVKLVARVTPMPAAPVRVYFKVFDTDNDNSNEPLTLPWSTWADTGTNGRPLNESEVTFSVSEGPECNYRAGASLIQESLSQDTMLNEETVDPQQHADALNSFGANWSGYSTPLTWSKILKTLRSVDLDGDADHNGVTTPDNPDEPLEDSLPGIIVLCNVDDDNNPPDDVRDNEGLNANTVDSDSDFDDLAPLVLRRLGTLPTTSASVTLSLHSPSNIATGVEAGNVVRIFAKDELGTSYVSILGPSTTSFAFPEDDPAHQADLTALRAGDIPLWAEGLEFAAEVKLRLDVNIGQSAAFDQIQLKVAPLIFTGHLQPATDSYVAQVTRVLDPAQRADSDAYVSIRFPGALPFGVINHIIGEPENSGYGRFPQDKFQIGYQEAPYAPYMPVVLDSKGGQVLANFPPSLLGPNFGYLKMSDGSATNTFDAFGNLEVSPPIGSSNPLGRIYYGLVGPPTQMDPSLQAFLDRQQIQRPVTFNTDWLLAGHVDELMTIVPNPLATHGWTVLFADSALAVDILKGNAMVPGGITPSLHLPRYAGFNNGHDVDHLGALLQLPASGGLTIEQYNAAGGPVHAMLLELRTRVSAEFNLNQSQDTLSVPVLFNFVNNPQERSGAFAITPNIVNSAVYGNVVIAPDPFLYAHTEEDDNFNYRLDPGEDDNGNLKLDTLRDPFKVWVNSFVPSNLAVQYIDDWLVYHMQNGEVHCSSNEMRTVPTSPKWWSTSP